MNDEIIFTEWFDAIYDLVNFEFHYGRIYELYYAPLLPIRWAGYSTLDFKK